MITAEDIKRKAFTADKNGYSQAEVDAFLDELAESVSESEQRVVTLVEALNGYKEDEEAIKTTLLNAQKEANKIIKDAKIKAEEMIENAQSEQQKISEQSAYECEKIVREHKEKCAKLITENTEITERKIAEIKRIYNEQKTKLENLKIEVTYFKSQLTSLYNKQLHLMMDIPELSDAEIEEIESKVEQSYRDEMDGKKKSFNPPPVHTSNVNKTVIQQQELADDATQEDIAKAIEEKKKKEKTAQLDKILNTAQLETVSSDTAKFNNLKFGNKS